MTTQIKNNIAMKNTSKLDHCLLCDGSDPIFIAWALIVSVIPGSIGRDRDSR